MTQKTITCNTTIEAEALIARLAEEGIESVKYDETNSKVARGIIDATMDVMVREEDYNQAKAVYDQMIQEQESFMPWCPGCGSENVEKVFTSDIKAGKVATTIASLATMIPFGGNTNTSKFHCKDCGKFFEH